ncbi:hypothetical protein ACE6H2_012236 [Prunus campanulata]
MASWVLLPVAPVTGRCLMAPVRTLRSSSVCVRSSLDTNVSDMSVNAPKALFPPEPEHYRGPKLKVAIIGAGLAGISTAFEHLDQGHETYDKARNAVALALGPVVKALVDPDGALRDVRNLDSDEASFGITNLLYTPDADFSCFAGLALTSPEDYYIEGQGSLLQYILTPGDPYIPLPNEEIIARVTNR